ncbi:MAG: hypothetical protein KME54_25720 [Tolypothrix brevis GSE-NOS-MK-07-07A]|nr:hypothetical protein [Tolypothrix brevis GSE-NOS-MK-07-07A]
MRDKHQIIEERNEGKLSRSVLKTSGTGDSLAEFNNIQFRQDYSETPINELLAYAKRLYGLKDLDAVRERRKAHKQQRTARWAEAS